MGTIVCFEDLDIWKLSRINVRNIYMDFKNCRDYNFINQVTSAGLSVMNNIAEGFGRESDKEFGYFLNISRGSAQEVKSMYYIASDLNYINLDTFNERIIEINLLVNSISKLKKYLGKKQPS